MARYEAVKVIANVERMLVQNDGRIEDIPAQQVPSDPMRRSVTERLSYSIIPSMRSYHMVGRVPPETRFAFAKKVLARLMRIVSGPQSAYNQNATAAVEVLAETAELMRSRMLTMEMTLKELRRQNTLLLSRVQELGGGTGAHSPATAQAGITSQVPASPDPDGDAFSFIEFQCAFRGEEWMLRERMAEYIPILREALPARELTARPRVLDIACGDGLFLDLIRAEGWQGRGIDLNPAVVEVARSRGLEVEAADAISFTHTCPPASFDIVTSFQFVEHLTLEQLSALMRGVARVLAPGGIVLFETLNPHTLMSLRWYNLDLTHRHLIMPETLSWLVERAGLKAESWQGVHPVDPSKLLPETGDADHRRAMRQLNEFLYGPQDYYLVARRLRENEVDLA